MIGSIALDIDETITSKGAPIPLAVIDYLSSLFDKGWQIHFVTGRTFHGALKLISPCPFPYLFSPYNGAVTYAMPEVKLLSKNYLSKEIIPSLEKVFSTISTDYTIFGGKETKDTVYYRKKGFSKKHLEHLLERQHNLGEQWQKVQNFDDAPDFFPTIKCFGPKKELDEIHKKLSPDFHIPIIKDPFSFDDFYIGQMSHSLASKDKAVKRTTIEGLPLIVAGDDDNDSPMFKLTPLSITMETAPSHVQKQAAIIAPPASKQGIIAGLKQALGKL